LNGTSEAPYGMPLDEVSGQLLKLLLAGVSAKKGKR